MIGISTEATISREKSLEAMNAAEIDHIQKAKRLDNVCDDIKSEAKKRIYSLAPEVMQRNIVMDIFLTLMKGNPSNKCEEDTRDLLLKVNEVYQDISNIRQISNELEHAAEEGRLPEEWKDNIYWS